MIRRHLELILVVAVFVAWQGRESFFVHPPERMSDGGDGLLNAWILLWDHHALTTPGVSIWGAPIFSPSPDALAFSENLFGLLWLTFPIQHFCTNPVLAVNAVLLVAFFLNAHATYQLSRTAGAAHFPAIFAGLMLACAPYLWSHFPHLQLISLYPGIYAWNFALRFLQRKQPALLLLSTVFLVWVFYCSIYLGLIFGIALGLFLPACLLFDRNARDVLRRRQFWLAVGAGAASAAVALWPLAKPYLEVARAWNASRTLTECARYSCELGSFLLPPHAARENHDWLLHVLPLPLRDGESAVFPGLLPLAIFLVACASIVLCRAFFGQTRPWLGAFVLTAISIAALMLGPIWIWQDQETNIHLPYALLHQLPGLGAVRVPARLVLPLLVCLAVIGALLLTAWQGRLRPSWARYALGLIALLLLALDYRLRPDQGFNARALLANTALDDFLLRQPSDAAVLYWPTEIGSSQVAAIQFEQAKHWRPLVNGTSGIFPASYLDLHHRLQAPRDAVWSQVLRDSPADILVLDPSGLPRDENRANLRERIRAAGFAEVSRLGSFDVFKRVAAAVRAGALDVRRLEVVVGASPREDLAWALLGAPADASWFAAAGVERRGTMEVRDASSTGKRSIRLHVPAMLAAGQTAGGVLQAGWPLREIDAPANLEIAGVSWGKSIPVEKIRLADTSANAERRNQLRATIKLVTPDFVSPLKTGQPLSLVLEVSNDGSTIWLTDEIGTRLKPRRGDVAAIVFWQPEGSSDPISTASRSALAMGALLIDHPLRPGETTRLSGTVPVPAKPGVYALRIDLVCQSIGWFSEVGPTRKIELRVAVE